MKKLFDVKISKLNNDQVNIEAHWQNITASINGAKPEAWIVAPELVLSAYWSCVVVNTQKAAKEMWINIENIDVELKAFKREEPLGFENLKVIVNIKSDESKEKLDKLVKIWTTNWTATNALLEWLKPKTELVIQK